MKVQLVVLAFALTCFASASARSLQASSSNSTCSVIFYPHDDDDDDGCSSCVKVDSHFFTDYQRYETSGTCGKTITLYDSEDCSSNNDDDDDQSKPLSVTDDDIDSDQDDLRSFIICN